MSEIDIPIQVTVGTVDPILPVQVTSAIEVPLVEPVAPELPITVVMDPELLIIGAAAIGSGGGGEGGSEGPAGPPGPQGEAGLQGAVGPQGPQGVQGSPGPTGAQGAAGSGVTMKGSMATSGQLPASGNQQGDAFVVQTDDSLWLWNGTQWVSGGSIAGPPGPSGVQGVQGPQGAQGPQGVQGAPAQVTVSTSAPIGTPAQDGILWVQVAP